MNTISLDVEVEKWTASAYGRMIDVSLRDGTSDVNSFEQIFRQGQYDLPLDFEPQYIVDGGAYIGLATVFFKMRWPNSVIKWIEPNPVSAQLLRWNTAGLSGVRGMRRAIWSHSSFINLVHMNSPWCCKTRECESSDPGAMLSMTVEDVFNSDRELGSYFPRIDLLKLDVEGAEEQIFSASDLSWLNRTRAIMVECHTRAALRSFLDAVEPRGFKTEGFGEIQLAIQTNWP